MQRSASPFRLPIAEPSSRVSSMGLRSRTACKRSTGARKDVSIQATWATNTRPVMTAMSGWIASSMGGASVEIDRANPVDEHRVFSAAARRPGRDRR